MSENDDSQRELGHKTEHRVSDMSKREPRYLNEGDFTVAEHLRSPEEFSEDEVPKVALHGLIKNAESVIGRLLDNVGKYVSEVVVVLNDCSDDTEKMLLSWGKENSKRVDITKVTYESHPALYILDKPETYNVGRSLCGENFGGPFTDGPILADWSAARNIAWERCRADWRLFLDADDTLQDPYSIWGLCEALATNRVDLALSKYHWAVGPDGKPKGASYRERLTSANENIRWIYPIHEVLYGSTKHAFIDGTLVTVDHRDSAGKDIRIPGRNFKILYQFARSHDWDIGSRMMLQLAEAGKPMPVFVREAIGIYLERSTWQEERGWAHRLLGETYEAEGNWVRASDCYEQALKEHPGSKAAFSLCRSRYHEGRFRECISAYEEGTKHSQILQVIDDGPLYADAAKILVADSWWRLGNSKKAAEVVKLAREAFPRSAPLAALEADILAGKSPPELHPELEEEEEPGASEGAPL
jgi:glycosyltransferase involved in cell wall biosynthesis